MTNTQVVRELGDVAKPTQPRYYRRTEAAEYIREKHNIPCQPKTLAKLACIGGGPVFRKAGRFPLYPEPGLDQWAESKLGPPVQSTSEIRRAA